MYAAQKKSGDHDQSVHTLPTRSSGIGDPLVHKRAAGPEKASQCKQ